MTNSTPEKITLYTSSCCAHAISVQSFLSRNDVPIDLINIDGDGDARQRLITINDGYASVPTLIFPDGTKLTEPTLFEIREKLGMKQPPGLADRIRNILSRKDEDK